MKPIITRTPLHTLDEMKEYLRIYHDAENSSIQSIYMSALKYIEARTRRFIAGGTIEYSSDQWHEEIKVGKKFLSLYFTTRRYKDKNGSIIQIDPSIEKDKICLGSKPDDFAGDLAIKATISPAGNDTLRNATLMLTAQWFENRGDQNLRGTPHWIEKICGTFAYQSF